MKPNSIKSKIRPTQTLFSLLTSNFSLPHLCAYKLKMQNEPNFTMYLSLLSDFLIETYNKTRHVNQKITNPIEPNTNPIEKRPKFNANFCYHRNLQPKTRFKPKNNKPNRTQTKPKKILAQNINIRYFLKEHISH